MLSHLFTQEMGDKPYLQIEVDEHFSNVGVITRMEAFLNSLQHRPAVALPTDFNIEQGDIHPCRLAQTPSPNVPLYLPAMGAYTPYLAAYFKQQGAATYELPPLPEEPPVTSEAPPPWDEPAPAAPPQRDAPPAPAQEVPAVQPQPESKPEYTADPALNKPRKVAAEGITPFPQWAEVIKLLQEQDPMLYTYLKKSKGYFDGTRVLIDGGKTFRDFIRANKESQKLIKKLIAQVSGVAVPIGPYESKTVNRASANAEESLRKLEQLGLEVSIEDSERKKR